jgi:hypothetical protein
MSRAKDNGKRGARVASKRATTQDSSPVRNFSLRAEKKSQDGITFAVTAFLADLRLTGSERVLGSLALALAEGMDASPAYAKGKLAHELREILTELAKAALSPENLTLLAGIEQ